MIDFTEYKHIVWDWNGTLLDDAWLCVEILNRMLSCRGMKKVTIDQYQEHFDFPVVDYYKKLGFDFDRESFDDIAREYIQAYESERFRCKLQKQAEQIIISFKEKGFLQSVLSACQQSSLIEALDFFGLSDFFENITGLDDYYAHGKVDAGKKLLKNITVSPEKILLIGDTVHDYEVASVLGADCLLLPAGHQSINRLEKSGAKVCADFNQAFKNLL
ncbi:MAG: HAD family hydrolase [Sedimentisphaerales bacterium]|nr:HAD family hydrolase [Sedimentisphaerales bacterium]